jgi:hypothetical protein
MQHSRSDQKTLDVPAEAAAGSSTSRKKHGSKHNAKILEVSSEPPDSKGSHGVGAGARAAEQQIIFKDLSSRSSLFRSKLMTEFRVLDNDYQSNNAPRIDSSTILSDYAMFSNILLERPQELVKFAPFKRTLKTSKERNKDHRLLRVRNRFGSVPLSIWAGWLVRTSGFSAIILVLICANAVLIGVETEISSQPSRENEKTMLLISLTDEVMLLCFSVEIIIKCVRCMLYDRCPSYARCLLYGRWLDNFRLFWSDSWNVFDFCVTCSSALPPILGSLAMADEGNLSKSQVPASTWISMYLPAKCPHSKYDCGNPIHALLAEQRLQSIPLKAESAHSFSLVFRTAAAETLPLHTHLPRLELSDTWVLPIAPAHAKLTAQPTAVPFRFTRL